jgi:hypothetical protein
VAEGARLESVYTLTGIVGSNPTLSAMFYHPQSFRHAYRLLPWFVRLLASLRTFAHFKGSVAMVPLTSAVCNSWKASITTLRCNAVLKGTPKWCPMGQGMNSALGTLIISLTSFATVTETVGTPLLSMARWISPTD